MASSTAPEDREFWLRSWRLWAGLTQAQLAERMGTTHSRVNEVENGAERFNETFLRRASAAIAQGSAQADQIKWWMLLAGPPEEVLPFAVAWSNRKTIIDAARAFAQIEALMSPDAPRPKRRQNKA